MMQNAILADVYAKMGVRIAILGTNALGLKRASDGSNVLGLTLMANIQKAN